VIEEKVFATPNTPTPNRPVIFNRDACIGCNMCVDVCQMDVFIPNPEKGEPPYHTLPRRMLVRWVLCRHVPCARGDSAEPSVDAEGALEAKRDR